ncbi:dynamin family protein [Yinghuangia sp. ASG 101]|uniref:dynamin family protein n=1 Tax=Yinghuangia sp. ASG 101 TaxID=2896848 RepID=UPI001E47A0D2|nr:dynamin family protein [Yinghuangia sp. ASG 101]UGQ09833.1 dynamin family protein [Yinghuangia sp. ASG 101]
MTIDREAVNARVAQNQPRRQTGVAGLLSGIHRSPELRGRLKGASIALPPVAERVDGAWTLTSLIAVGRREPQAPVIHVTPAWGAVQWEWPSQNVIRLVTLAEHPAAADMLAKASGHATGWNLSMQAEALAARARFFQTLTRFVSEPGERDLKLLTRAYAQVLPRAAYGVYHALVPSTRTWLQIAPGQASSGREARSRSAGASAEAGVAGLPGPSRTATPRPAASAAAPAGAVRQGPGAPARGTEPSSAGVGPRRAAAAAPATPARRTPEPHPGGGPSLVKSAGAALSTPITDAWELAERFGLEQICTEVDRLRARMRRPGFRIAVVGEFGRGKSSLVNRLLGAQVVPEGRHTRVPVVIAPGPEARLELQYAGGRSEVRPAVSASWADVDAAASREGDDALIGVRVLVEDPELARLDVEIIDTPGVNAGLGARDDGGPGDDDKAQDLVRRTVAASDAVFMVVSASAPLGISETSFLEEEVIARHVPRITVVVSKLDTIDEDEREDIVDYLTGRVRRISPDLAVLAGPHREDDAPVGAVRGRLEQYAVSGGRRAMRARQTAGQLLGLLEEMAELARQGVAAGALGVEERRRAAEEAEVEIDNMTAEWGKVRVELQKRRGTTAEKFREHLAQSQDELLGVLSYEMERTPDPKTWWERDLPFRLRRELTALAKKYEGQLHSSVQADLQWLDAQMKRHFGKGTTHKVDKAEQLSTEFELNEAEELGLKDLKSRKLAWRIGPSGVAVLGMLLIPLTGGLATIPMGAGMAASVGGMVLGEVKSGSLTEGQRAQAAKALEPAIEELLAEFSRQVSDRLYTLYAGVMDEAVRGQKAWRTDRLAALGAQGGGGPDWPELFTRTQDLISTVGALIDGDDSEA